MTPKHHDIGRGEFDILAKAEISLLKVFPLIFSSGNYEKKGGKLRICVHFRVLDRRLKRINLCFQTFRRSAMNYLEGSILHLWTSSGALKKIRMSRICNEKTAFVCRFKTFLVEMMPFGSIHVLAIFKQILDGQQGHLSFEKIYLNNVVVFSESVNISLSHQQEVFTVIAEHGLKLKAGTCDFVKRKCFLLEHIVNKMDYK